MSQYRFVATGDYVDFYDSSMHVIQLHNTSRCVTWFFDDTEGLTFRIDRSIYHTDNVEDISFDDDACETKADFITGIEAMFPDLAGGGPGATPGIDDVLAQEQTVSSRFIEVQVDGLFEIITSNSRNLLQFDTTTNAETSSLEANNLTGLGNSGRFLASTTNLISEAGIRADFNDGEKVASILGHADASGSNFEYSADTHTFNGDFKLGTDNTWDLNGKFFKLWQVDDHVLLLDPNQFKALISATQGGESGTNSNLVLYADPLGEGVTAHLVSQTGGNNADILLDGANETITHTADQHVFVGAVMLPTSDPGVPGAIWNNAGTPAISA